MSNKLRPSWLVSTPVKPVFVHLVQKLRCDRETRRLTDYRVNATLVTQGTVAVIDPFDNLTTGKCLLTVEAAADVASQNLFTMMAARLMRLDVQGLFTPVHNAFRLVQNLCDHL